MIVTPEDSRARTLIDAFSTRRTEITRPLEVFGAASAHAAQKAALATRRAKTHPPSDAVRPRRCHPLSS